MSDNPGSDATSTGIYAQADFAPGTVLGGRFRIVSILGIGGMGVVYRADDLALGVPVALKLLRPELAHRGDVFERFRQELLLARQVSSPHVVRIHDLAQHDGRWLLSMDFVDGEGLDKRIDREGPLPVEAALRIARQVAEGLSAAHAKGVVHRDLKPANLLLDAQGDAYISDFGVARSLATSGMTQGGAVVGTPDYLSPEQARGEPADARSDLYALGLILYEMLTGEQPFAGGTVAEVLAQRMLRPPRPIGEKRRDLPAWVARLVDKLLRAQPAHRFQTAVAVIEAIDRREVPREFRPRRAAWMPIAGLLGLALAGGAWWWQRDPQPQMEAAPPLDRLLVVPITMSATGPDGTAMPPARLAALSARMRDALASMPGHAVVDGERTMQALRQLDPGGNARIDIAALREVAIARRILQPHLASEDGRWRVRALLHDGKKATLTLQGAASPDPVAALRAWIRDSAVLRGMGLPPGSLVLALPDGTGALDAYGTAVLARNEGRLGDALRALRQATALAPGDATAWLAQARVAHAIGEEDVAFEAVEQGQRAAGDGDGPLQRRLLAERALLEGDAPVAVAQWRAQLARTPGDTEAELRLARAQGAGGDFPAAIATLQALLKRDNNDPRAWFELGKFSILSGDAQRAVDEYLVRALVLYKRGRDPYGEGETVNALGIGYGRLGQTADAEAQYRQAILLRRAVGNPRGEATSLRNLGNVLALNGKFNEAATLLEQARVLHTRLGDREGLAAVENEMGLLAEERGDYPAALEAFRRALQAWQQVGDQHGSAQVLNDIGFAHYQLGAYDDAQVYWQQAANAYAAIGSETGRIRTEQNLGLLDLTRGRWNDARRRLQSSLQSAERQQMLEEAAVSRRNLAELEVRQGHIGAAIEQARKAEDAFRQRKDVRGESDAVLLHVQALMLAGADAQARQRLAQMESTLAGSSSEQRAIAQILRAEMDLRRGDAPAARTALRQARKLATEAGVRQLLLRIDLLEARQRQRPDPALERGISALGHADLRLEWLQFAMERAISAGDMEGAVALYRQASVLLRGGEQQHARAIHLLGARAMRATGDAAGARMAGVKAEAAYMALRRDLPAALTAGFDTRYPPRARNDAGPT